MSLVWLSAAFVAGVIAGHAISVPAAVCLSSVGALAAAACIPALRRFRLPMLIVAALILGFARAPTATSQTNPSTIRYYTGHQVHLDGVVTAEPDIRDTGANYVVSVRDRVTIRGKQQLTGQVLVHVSRGSVLEYGDTVSLSGRLLANRGGGGPPVRMSFPRVLLTGTSDMGWLGWVVPFRQHIESGINQWLPEPEAALLIAIALGSHSAALGALAPILVATGLIHIIAISGIKVALVAGTVYEILRFARQRLVALTGSLAILLLYVLLTGATASGERSAFMWAFVFLAEFLGRGTVTVVSLCFASALMVGLDPSIPWDIGFQLSVAGTFAIVAFAGPLLRVFRFVLPVVRESLCVTLAAQIGTIPVVAVGFHSISLSGPLANAVVLPVLPVLIVAGFLLGVVAPIGWLAGPIAALSYALLHGVILVATALAGHLGAVTIRDVSPLFVVVYFIAFVAVAAWTLNRSHWAPRHPFAPRSRELLIGLVVGASLLTVTTVTAAGERQTVLTWLGTGNATLFRAGGQTVLVDGSNRPFLLLQRLGQALPYRARDIDAVVVTDPRASNVAGLEAVLAHYRVSVVLDVGSEYPSTTYARWRAELRRRAIPVYALRTHAAIEIGGATISAVGPDSLYSRPQDSNGMLLITAAGSRVLLAGASSRREQVETVFRPVDVHADVVLAGNKDGLDERFLRAVGAREVFQTVGSPGGTYRTLNPLQEVPLRRGR